jgi:hypothetical protein
LATLEREEKDQGVGVLILAHLEDELDVLGEWERAMHSHLLVFPIATLCRQPTLRVLSGR